MKYLGFWTALATVGGLVLGGCESVDSPSAEGSVSDPGGFAEPEKRLTVTGEESYCRAEVLRWRYDVANSALKLADSRLLLNCCGQRAMRVDRIDRMVEITEKDEPDASDRRCESVCSFDFTVGISDVPNGRLYLKLMRDVTDVQGSAALVWQGEIDLSQAFGAVVLDSDAAPGDACSEPT